MTKRDPANIDTSDHQCVFLIVRLLFEPADPKKPLPDMRIGAMFPSPSPEDQSLWPLFPLAMQDDIPFLLIDEEHKKIASKLKIRWSAQHQRYVTE